MKRLALVWGAACLAACSAQGTAASEPVTSVSPSSDERPAIGPAQPTAGKDRRDERSAIGPAQPTTLAPPGPRQSTSADASPPASATTTAIEERPSSPPRSGTGTGKSDLDRYAEEICACTSLVCLQTVSSRWQGRLVNGAKLKLADLSPKQRAAVERALACALKAAH